MTKILCIETSGLNCSVAISKDSTLLAERTENKGKFTHAESLHVFINEVVSLADISLGEIDAIAVSGGPGSYTGLRIGVSTAKGLCFALNKPLIAISTLQILASQVIDNEIIIPMIDARRMEVYSAVFDRNFNEIEKTEAKILDKNSYAEWLSKGKVAFLGDGVDKFSEICDNPNAVFVKNAYPQARDMIIHALEKFKNNAFEDIAYFEPNYLK